MVGRYDCEGQLDIFSFLETETREPPILLQKGQIVYLVNKGDVITARVVDDEDSWVCWENNRGYRLIRESGGYDCTWNIVLGIKAFTKYHDAKAKADEYLKAHDGIILAEDINPINTVAYSYIRDCDKQELIAFYCDLGNNMYYIKEFMTYHHICKGEKAVKEFMEQQTIKHGKSRQIEDYTPHFKNMYKCMKQSDWDYAECEYTYTIG